jgi:hypothetical protein
MDSQRIFRHKRMDQHHMHVLDGAVAMYWDSQHRFL